MAGTLANLIVKLNLDSAGFVAGSAAVEGELKKLGSSSQNTHSSIGHLGTVANVAGATLAAALAVGAVASVKAADDFQQSMTLIRTQAGDTTDNMGQLQNSILGLAGQVGQTPKDLADAYYHLASAGYSGKQALDILTQTAKLADVGQAGLEQTTQAVLYTMKSGIPGIKDAGDAVGQLNAIVGQGDMRMGQLTDAMSSGLLPTAATFGVSLRSVGAALDFMADRGVPPIDAANRLRMSLTMMAAPTKQAAKFLEDAGVGAKDAADQTSAMQQVLEKAGVTQTKLSADLKSPDGIVTALKDLKGKMEAAGVSAGEQSALISRAFGGGRTGGPIMMMWNQLDQVQQKFGDLGGASKSFGDDYAKQQDTFNQKLKDANASIDATKIELGNALLPVVKNIADWVGKNLPGAINTLLPIVITVTGLFVAWKLVMLTIGIVNFISNIIQMGGAFIAMAGEQGVATAAATLFGVALDAIPIFAIIAGIVALIGVIVLVVTHFQQVSGAVGAAFGAVKSAIGDVINWVIDRINDLIGLIDHIPGVHINAIGHINWDQPTITGSVANVHDAQAIHSGSGGHALAQGGIALARPGGVPLTAAEAGYDEAVIPLPPGWRSLSSAPGGNQPIQIDARIVNPVFQGTPEQILRDMDKKLNARDRELVTTLRTALAST